MAVEVTTTWSLLPLLISTLLFQSLACSTVTALKVEIFQKNGCYVSTEYCSKWRYLSYINDSDAMECLLNAEVFLCSHSGK